MPRSPFVVAYEATDFIAPPPFALAGQLHVTWRDLVRAVVTVGRWWTDVLTNDHDYIAAAHRALYLHAYLHTADGALRHAPAYACLDPSEKGIVSYYVGKAAAKIFAERRLGVPWLMHIRRYGAAWAVTYASPRRPDLFGPDATGAWTVAEAKGRVRMRAALVARMQQQKSAVAHINGTPPAYRIGTATRFSKRELALRIVDPPEEADAEGLTVDPALWLASYYAPFVQLLLDQHARDDDGFVSATLPATDVQVGLRVDVIELLRTRPTNPTPPTAPSPVDPEAPLRSASLSAQSDKTLAGWLDDLVGRIADSAEAAAAPDGVRVKLGDAWS